MKTLLIIAFQLCWILPSFAQDLTIEWGDEFDSKTQIQKILGFSSKKMVAYTKKGSKRYIETYNESGFKLLKTTEYKLPAIDGKKTGLLNITLSGSNVATLLHVYRKSDKTFKLYAHILDVNGKQVSKPKMIYSSGADAGRVKDPKVSVVFSRNNSKALVYFDRKNKDRTTFMTDMVVVDLDDKMEVLAEVKEEFEIRDSKSEKINFKAYHSIENDGSYGLIQEKVEIEKRKIVDFNLNVARYSMTGKEIGSSDIEKSGAIFMSPTLIVKDGKTRVVGYYTNNEKGRQHVAGYTGLFVATFNESMELDDLKTNRFSDEFLKNLYTKRRVAKAAEKGKELLVPAPYTMDEIYIHANGQMTVLSEYYTKVTSQDSRGQTTTTTTYGSILFFKLDKDGNLNSSDAIHKIQTSTTGSIGLIGASSGAMTMFVSVELADRKAIYWGYASSEKDGNVYLVFNDHFKNDNDDEDKLSRVMANPKRSVPFLVTIEPDGEFSKEAMVESGDSETYLVPQVTFHTDENEFVIWGIWRKKNKFGLAAID